MVASANKRRNRRERKKEMKKLMMMAVAVLCCAAMAQESERRGPRPEGPRGGMRHHEIGMDPIVFAIGRPQFAEKLGLSDEQKAKLKDVADRVKGGRDNMKRVREATMRQIELMKAEKIDEAAVMKSIDEVFDLRKQMAKEQVKRVIEIKSILTPEQIAKAREEMKKSFEERGTRGPHRGGKGRGPRGGGAADAK